MSKAKISPHIFQKVNHQIYFNISFPFFFGLVASNAYISALISFNSQNVTLAVTIEELLERKVAAPV
jgi:hypothetical protein